MTEKTYKIEYERGDTFWIQKKGKVVECEVQSVEIKLRNPGKHTGSRNITYTVRSSEVDFFDVDKWDNKYDSYKEALNKIYIQPLEGKNQYLSELKDYEQDN